MQPAQTAREPAIVERISKELSRELSEGGVDSYRVQRVATAALSQMVPGTWVSVLMNHDPTTSQVVVADHANPAIAGYVDRLVAELYRPGRAPTTGLSQRVIESGRPVLMPQIPFQDLQALATPAGAEYVETHPFPITPQTIGLLVVPMRCLGAVVGTLGVFQYDSPTGLSEDDFGWFQEVADRVAIAAELTQLHARAIDRQARLMAIENLAFAIRSTRDLRLTLELVLEHLVAALKVDAADVLTVDESTKELVTAAKAGFRSASMPDHRFPVPDELLAAAARGRGPERVSEMDWIGQFRRRSSFAREGFQAYRLAPLIVGNRLVGVMEVFQRTPLEPDSEWLGFFDTLAGQAALAIEIAAMREKLGELANARPVRSQRAAPDLSPRERQILAMVVEGGTNQEIADKLHLSHNTIKFHVRQLLEKLGSPNRTELASRVTQQGWL